MNTSITLPGKSLMVWLFSLASPTLYCLLVLLLGRAEVPDSLKPIILLLFLLVPVAALIICESLVWRSTMTVAWKMGWFLFTLLVILLQLAVLVFIVRAILIAATAYAQ